MSFRFNWFFIIFIYLSVNGELFAKPMHICPEMALSSSALPNSPQALNIHSHAQSTSKNIKLRKINLSDSELMDNCQCIDCDCVQNIAGQASTFILQTSNLGHYLPFIPTFTVESNQYFISQPQASLYRPPIYA